MRARTALSAVWLLSAFALPAGTEAWEGSGEALCTAPGGQDQLQVIPDGAGGVIAAWRDGRAPNAVTWVFAQRLTAAGTVATGWPANGVRLGISSAFQGDPVLVSDEAGGAFVAWVQQPTCAFDCDAPAARVQLQRLTPDGGVASGWPAAGIPIDPASATAQESPRMVADGAGGVVIVWASIGSGYARELRAQRFNADGTRRWAGGASAGVSITPAAGEFAIAPGGGGSMYVVWGRSLSRHQIDILGQRLDGAGTQLWDAGGIALTDGVGRRHDFQMAGSPSGGALLVWTDQRSSTSYTGVIYDDLYGQVLYPDGPRCAPCANTQLGALTGSQRSPRIAADGAGGAVVVWQGGIVGGNDVYALRVDGTLAPAPGWPADGLALGAGLPALRRDPAVIVDEADTVTVVWSDERDAPGRPWVVATRLSPRAATLPGWPAGGLPVCPAPGPQHAPQILPAPGGAIAVWLDQRTAPGPFPGSFDTFDDVYAQQATLPAALSTVFMLAGSHATSERVTLIWVAPGGAGVAATVQRRTETSDWSAIGPVAADAEGWIRFEDHAVTPGGHYGYRLAVVEGGVLVFMGETWITVPGQPRLALSGARPNPSPDGPRVWFELPDDSPATLALFDLAGRQVDSREVGSLGAGAHSVALGPRALPAGVYLVRLRHGGRELQARASVLR